MWGERGNEEKAWEEGRQSEGYESVRKTDEKERKGKEGCKGVIRREKIVNTWNEMSRSGGR